MIYKADIDSSSMARVNTGGAEQKLIEDKDKRIAELEDEVKYLEAQQRDDAKRIPKVIEDKQR